AVALDLDLEAFGQDVDDGRTHTAQAAGHGVSAAAELASGVEDGKDHLDGRLALRRVHGHGHPAPELGVLDSYVGSQRDLDVVAVRGHRLIDGVVDDLRHEVVETAFRGRTDVQAGSFPDGLEALEYRDVAGIIMRLILGRHVTPCSDGRYQLPILPRRSLKCP